MLRGTLDDFTLADIFKLLSFSKKTGRVEMKRKAGMGRVFFRDGDVYFAESSLSREPLGQKLTRAHALTDAHLRKALDEHSESGERVGQILVRHGWVTEEQLEAAVKQQIEDSVFDLLRWEIGDFEWEPNVTLEPEVPISVSVENLIMESSRRLDELEVIGRKVPSPQAVLAVAPAPPEGAVEINITPDEWRVLVLVDGHRTVETIANTIGLDEFQTMRIVHGMVSAGLIAVAGTDETQAAVLAPPPPAAEEAPPPPPPIEETIGEPVETHEVDGVRAPAEPDDDAPADTPALDETPETVPLEGSSVDDVFTFQIEPEVGSNEDTTEATEGAGSTENLEDLVSAAFPSGEDVVEETLYEVSGEDASEESESAETVEAPAPPAEWFEDPNLSMDMFDTPLPGDVLTELPDGNENGSAVTHEASDVTTEHETQDALADDALADDPLAEDSLAPDALGTDEPTADAADAEQEVEDARPEPVRTPPPPPVAPVEGAERTRAVRELADLFEDVPVERPKRPVIRRIEPVDPETKRRVEDDEQVTKSLISRLIEGVKGL